MAKKILQYVIFLGIAIFMVWFALKDINKIEVLATLKTTNISYVLLIVIVGIISIVLRAYRWVILIKPLGKTPSLLNTTLSIFIGYGVNFFTPRLGEIARCGILSKYEQLPADKLAGTMIAERLFDLICLILLIFTTLFIESKTVVTYFDTILIENFSKNIYIYITIIGIALFTLLFFGIRYILKQNSTSKVGLVIKNIVAGVISIFKIKNLSAFLLSSLLIWVCYWGMTFLGFKALPETAGLNAGAGLSILMFGSLGFLFPFGGAGAYSKIVSAVLINLYFINKAPADSYGLLSWTLQNGILLLGAFVAILILPYINSKHKVKV